MSRRIFSSRIQNHTRREKKSLGALFTLRKATTRDNKKEQSEAQKHLPKHRLVVFAFGLFFQLCSQVAIIRSGIVQSFSFV